MLGQPVQEIDLADDEIGPPEAPNETRELRDRIHPLIPVCFEQRLTKHKPVRKSLNHRTTLKCIFIYSSQ